MTTCVKNIKITNEEFKFEDEVIANYILLSFKLDEDLLYFIMDDLCYKIDLSLDLSEFILWDFYINTNLNKESIFFNKRILLLDEFIIKESFRGKDIGSTILDSIKDKAKNHGYDYIVLKPYPIGHVNNSKFYSIYQKILKFYSRNNYTSLDLAGTEYQYYYQKIN